VRVTLVDRRNHHVFQPLLYQVASAVLSPGDIAAPIRWILRNHRRVEVLLAEAKEVDPVNRRIQCGDRWIEYDYLVLAAGMRNHWFGRDEWAPHAPGLKSTDDALEIRRRVLLAFERAEWEANPDRRRQLLTFVVVGGGPTGVELAGALSEIARQTLLSDFAHIDPSEARVVLVEGADRVLGSFSDPLPERAAEMLQRVGVELMLGQRVESIDEDGVKVGGQRIEAATVLWGAGVAGEPIGGSVGVGTDRQGRVPVRTDLSVDGFPNVFVVGDLARFEVDGQPLPGVAQVAIQMGKHVGAQVAADRAHRARTPFQYKDLGSMATVGRRLAVADAFGLRLWGSVAWFAWLFVHLMALVGFRNRYAVLVQWAWSYTTFQRSHRLIRGRAGDSALTDDA
jgi:NADH dehydrogenase